MRQIVSFWSDGQPLGFYLNIYLNKFCLLCPGQRAWTIWGRWSVNFESEFMNLPKFRFRWERTLDFMTRAWLSQCLEMKNVTSVVNCGFFEAQHMCVWARYIFPLVIVIILPLLRYLPLKKRSWQCVWHAPNAQDFCSLKLVQFWTQLQISARNKLTSDFELYRLVNCEIQKKNTQVNNWMAWQQWRSMCQIKQLVKLLLLETVVLQL